MDESRVEVTSIELVKTKLMYYQHWLDPMIKKYSITEYMRLLYLRSRSISNNLNIFLSNRGNGPLIEISGFLRLNHVTCLIFTRFLFFCLFTFVFHLWFLTNINLLGGSMVNILFTRYCFLYKVNTRYRKKLFVREMTWKNVDVTKPQWRQ